MSLVNVISHPIPWLGAAIITFAHWASGFGDWLLFFSLFLLVLSGELTVLRADRENVRVEIRVKIDGKWYLIARKECRFDRKFEYYTQFSPRTLRIVSLYALVADVKIFVMKRRGKWDVFDAP